MKSLVIIWFSCLTLSVVAQHLPKDVEKVKVGYYYESYCGDCKLLFSKQVWPTFELLGDIMDIDMVPAGFMSHKNTSKGVIFKCQHEMKECTANMIHICAIHVAQNFTSAMRFIYCMESSEDPLVNTETCAESAGISIKSIIKCGSSDLGTNLLIEQERKTKKIHPWHVPWVLINNHHSRAAEKDFKKAICKAYKGPKPAACG